MPIVALPAHYDGEQICLDEAFDLKPGARLIVTVLSQFQSDKEERENWLSLSGQSLENAYGENEPDYSSNLLKEENAKYEAG